MAKTSAVLIVFALASFGGGPMPVSAGGTNLGQVLTAAGHVARGLPEEVAVALATPKPTPAALSAPSLESGVPRLVSDLPPRARRCFALRLPDNGGSGASDGVRVRVLAAAVGLAGSPILRGGWLPDDAEDLPIDAEGDDGELDDSRQVAGGVARATEVGFEMIDHVVERVAPQYYLCVTTMSTQGCDALLTAITAAPDASEFSPVWLRASHPSVWTLGDGAEGAPPRALRFAVEADDLEDLRVSVVPVSGQLDIAVYVQEVEAGPPPGGGVVAQEARVKAEVELCQGEPLKVLLARDLPDIVDVHHTQGGGADLGDRRRVVCVRVGAAGQDGAVASVTVGPRLPGPFLASSVLTGGKFAPVSAASAMSPSAQPPCEWVRLLVNRGADTTVVASTEDSSPLRLGASLCGELPYSPSASTWQGGAPLGGQGAVLQVRGADVAMSAAEVGGRQGEACLSIAVCRLPSSDSLGIGGGEEAPRFWITASTDRDVVILEDGRPFDTSLRADASAGGGRPASGGTWRDFRFFVPDGDAVRPKQVTITATAPAGLVRLVADTRRHPGRPGAYRWASPAADAASGHAALRLTTEQSGHLRTSASGIADDTAAAVHFVDCRLPCFVYVSASAEIPSNTSRNVDLQIQVQSDSGKVKDLVEAQEQDVTLAAGETQIFHYEVPGKGDEAVLFTLSVSSGTSSFEVSASASFPHDEALTSRRADDIVLLEPGSPLLRAATAAAKATNASRPVLFVRVLASSRAASTFAVVASAAGAAKSLWNGEDTRGAVDAFGYDRYRFFLGRDEVAAAEAGLADGEGARVSIDIVPLVGHAKVFIACSPNEYPRPGAFDWLGDSDNRTSIVFGTKEAAFTPGWVYIGIVGTETGAAAYTLRVRWTAIAGASEGSPAAPKNGDPVETEMEKLAEEVAESGGARSGGGGAPPAAALQDGMEEFGHLDLSATAYYTFLPEDPPGPADAASAAALLRLEALGGALGLCVEGLRAPGARALASSLPAPLRRAEARRAADAAGCSRGLYLVANASDASSGGLAAVDVPLAAAQAVLGAGGEIKLWVRGLSPRSSGYALRALGSDTASATIAEEHQIVVDTLRASCCLDIKAVAAPAVSAGAAAPATPALRRRFVHFVRRPPLSPGEKGGDRALELELRALAPRGPSPPAQALVLRARQRRDGRGDPFGKDAAWPIVERLSGDGRLLVFAGLDRLIGVQDTPSARSARQDGFWVEVDVSGPTAAAFALRFGAVAPAPAEPSTPRSAARPASAWLHDGARVAGLVSGASARQGRRFDFDRVAPNSSSTSAADADGAGLAHLYVEECTGAISVALPGGAAPSSTAPAELVARNGRGEAATAPGRWDLALPALAPSRRAVDLGHGALLVASLEDGVNSTFEVELVLGANGSDAGLALPTPARLVASAEAGELSFGAAEAAPRIAGGSGLGAASAVLIRYTAIALPPPPPPNASNESSSSHAPASSMASRASSASRPNANTLCGLRAALASSEAYRGIPVEVSLGKPVGEPLKALLPGDVPMDRFATNGSLWVNVLVEAIDAGGRPLAARTYAALELNVTQAVAALGAAAVRAGAVGSAGAASRASSALLLMLALAASWVSMSRAGWCPRSFDASSSRREFGGAKGTSGGKRGASGLDEVELEVQYDLHSDEELRAEGGAGIAVGGGRRAPSRGGYVPPSV